MFDPVEKLKEYVRQGSVSADPQFKAGMAGAQQFLTRLLTEIGFKVELVPTALHPVLLAKRGDNPAWPHVIIYGHYDVQPPDPLDKWVTPPFEPTIRGERIYGRGTADNKGPLLVHITAVARLLEKNPHLPLRLTFMVEGEEEIGSKNFKTFLKENKEKLRGDFIYMSDNGILSPDQMIITVGLRGMLAFEIELTGPNSDLHSGMHGGVLMNPLQALAELCASLHTPDGRVNLPGFYDAVVQPEPWEREQLAKAGLQEKDYAAFLGIKEFHTPPGYTPFEAIRFLPTLEFNGFSGGYQGEGTKTVIPSKAKVKITCRLVPNQTPDNMKEAVFNAIKARCPKGVTMAITPQHNATPYVVIPPDRSNTPKNQSPALAKCFRAVDKAATEVFGKPPIYLREGGSVGLLADLKEVLGLDAVMMGLFLPEDNLHAPNESFHLGVMKKGIDTSERVLAELAKG
ncbi:M20/M25/M40 family metallo-hydrolase [Opitutus sp. GAS368]|jgi:acetylornithine deacetylase/succinyl-diaminopimelate desuccinylase-like protein|uniref:M20/M25/M40 family metallo-hydrolase n=1 Tax=Opitutus sp. GAS368 TaxID=1882749 RepID=UPI000879FD73|nr:M20/M25/M40 family metallo-hydrolase [Opitutus sp. GAS368]SDS57103.1 Acetylornithine deacetylase/Succinyl-diaminopimelate desuccinylase [Opitutus sp. GAS368]